jgi:hypothetical protein
MPETLVERTPEILKATRRVLDRLHRYIEQQGFDVSIAAADFPETDDPDEAQEIYKAMLDDRVVDVNVGEVCFIGGARLCAGVHPGEWSNESTDWGNGPELTVALELLDEAAGREADSDEIREAQSRNERTRPGGIAEALAFMRQDEADWSQGSFALGIVRSALTWIDGRLADRASRLPES